MDTNEMNMTAAHANTDTQTEAAANPLATFQEVANNLIADRSKDALTKAAIAYGFLNSLVRDNKITPEQMVQVYGSFMINVLNLAC